MIETIEVLLWAAVVGIGATIILDICVALFSVFGIHGPDWGNVGRWIANIPNGRLYNDDIENVAPVKGERALGWVVHYILGIAYALFLVAIWGSE